MAIRFDDLHSGPLQAITAEAPAGATIGLLSEDVESPRALLRAAAGLDRPAHGAAGIAGSVRIAGPFDPLDLSAVDNLLLDHALAFYGAAARARVLSAVEDLRRQGATILLATHDEALLEQWCDELWWLQDGKLALQGDPRQVLTAYRRHVALQLAAASPPVRPAAPRFRRGDGRARLVSLETLNSTGQPSSVWMSHEPVAVRVTVEFQSAVEDPVVGILLRTRIGLEVYGTNTELEQVKLGPVEAGARRAVTFSFPCHLCAREYTLTAASHDPDGTWHDWAEDALVVTVQDTRYTAGVANLSARVAVA
jgi:hypothetical protein